MLGLEVVAWARIGCPASAYSVGDTHSESKLQKPNPQLASTRQSHPPCLGHLLRPNLGLNASRLDRDPRQNTEKRIVPEENGRLRIRKFEKERNSASRIGRSGANASTNYLLWTRKSRKH